MVVLSIVVVDREASCLSPRTTAPPAAADVAIVREQFPERLVVLRVVFEQGVEFVPSSGCGEWGSVSKAFEHQILPTLGRRNPRQTLRRDPLASCRPFPGRFCRLDW